jgi:serine/threonine protein kinase
MDIRIANRFKVIKKIGNGSFGKIYEGQDTITSERVAIKLESMLIKFP